MNGKDRVQMGYLLQTDDGLTTDWSVVKRVCGRFDKRRDWEEKDSAGAGTMSARIAEAPLPARKEETRTWLDTGPASASAVKGPVGRSSSRVANADGSGPADRAGTKGWGRTGPGPKAAGEGTVPVV